MRPSLSIALVLGMFVVLPSARADSLARRASCSSSPSVTIDASLHKLAGGYGGFLYAVTWAGGYSTGSTDLALPSITVTDETGAVLNSGNKIGGVASLPAGPHTLTVNLSSECGTASASSSVTVPPRNWAVKFEKLGSSAVGRGRITQVTYEAFPVSDVWHPQGPMSLHLRFGGSGTRITSIREIQPENRVSCTYGGRGADCVDQRKSCGNLPACAVAPHVLISFVGTRGGTVTVTGRMTPPSGDVDHSDDAATVSFAAQ